MPVNAIVHDCVGALLVRGDRLLLGRRAPDRAWLPGAWGVFGGHIEAHESAEQALRRELREELGVAATRLRPGAVLIGGDAGATWRLQLFVVEAWEGEPQLRQPQEHAQLAWCSLAEACERLAGAHPEFPAVLADALRDG
jgi:8-oxo-dGTP diphosphatase